MDLLHAVDVAALLDAGPGPCVSLFVPTRRVETRTASGPAHLKNLFREAEGRLLESGLRAPAAREFLEPARRLSETGLFWQYQSDGLAIFLRPGWFRSWRLPLELDPLVVVGDRFHMRPLLPLLTGDGHFFVLALSQNEVSLLEGTRQRVDQVDLPEVPQGLREALKHDDPEKQLQPHVAGRGGGAAPAVFHGHGPGGEEHKDRVLQYFRQIDHGLAAVLGGERAPLVLTGVESLLPIYRKANTYPYLVDGGITGNPDHLPPEELHAQAWRLVEPIFRQAQEAAVARFRRLAGTGRTTSDLGEVLRAAHEQRVDTLFVAAGHRQLGTYDPETGAVETGEGPRPDAEDVLDLAAVLTLRAGGVVYSQRPEGIPDSAVAAALLRY